MGNLQVEWVEDPTQAEVRIEPSPDRPLTRWIYAVVAPFPTIEDQISLEELRRAWTSAESEIAFYLTDRVANELATLLGSEAKLQLASGERILDQVWEARNAYAIIPFEKLEPRWKVIRLDNRSPLDRDFDSQSYPLVVSFGLSGDPELEYFGDGLTEDIITSLSKYQELSVTARNSVFAYKNKPVDVRQVAEALGVGYVLEGSVRISEAENRVRVTAQLIDGATGNHLWAEKYDRTMESVFGLQDEITDKISVALDVALLEGELSQERRSTTEIIEAYELFKRANELYSLETIEANTKAKELSRQVIALDPESPLGWMQLAFCHWEDLVLGGWSQHPQKDLDQAYQSISKSIAIDDSMPENYMLLGFLHLYAKRYAEARAEAEHAVNLSPNNADGVGVLGQILNFLGEPKEAIVNLEKAFRLAPTPPKWLHPELGHAYFLIAQYDKAVEVLQQGVSRFPDYYRGYLYLAAAYGALGRESEAEMAVAQVLRMRPNFTVEELEPWILQHKNPDHVEHLRNGLREAGLK